MLSSSNNTVKQFSSTSPLLNEKEFIKTAVSLEARLAKQLYGPEDLIDRELISRLRAEKQALHESCSPLFEQNPKLKEFLNSEEKKVHQEVAAKMLRAFQSAKEIHSAIHGGVFGLNDLARYSTAMAGLDEETLCYVKEIYQARYKKDLTQDVKTEFVGVFYSEVERAVEILESSEIRAQLIKEQQGDVASTKTEEAPTTIQEYLAREEKRLAHEEAGFSQLKYGLKLVSYGLLPLGMANGYYNYTDELVDRFFLSEERKQMQSDFASLKNAVDGKSNIVGLTTDERNLRVSVLSSNFRASADILAEQRKAVTDAFAQGATTVAVISVSLATAGTATPMMVAAYSGLTSLGTTVGTKSLLNGMNYSLSEFGMDSFQAGTDALFCGLGNIYGRKLLLEGLQKSSLRALQKTSTDLTADVLQRQAAEQAKQLLTSTFKYQFAENIAQSVLGDTTAGVVGCVPMAYQMWSSGKDLEQIVAASGQMVGMRLVMGTVTAGGFTVIGSAAKNISFQSLRTGFAEIEEKFASNAVNTFHNIQDRLNYELESILHNLSPRSPQFAFAMSGAGDSFSTGGFDVVMPSTRPKAGDNILNMQSVAPSHLVTGDGGAKSTIGLIVPDVKPVIPENNIAIAPAHLTVAPHLNSPYYSKPSADELMRFLQAKLPPEIFAIVSEAAANGRKIHFINGPFDPTLTELILPHMGAINSHSIVDIADNTNELFRVVRASNATVVNAVDIRSNIRSTDPRTFVVGDPLPSNKGHVADVFGLKTEELQQWSRDWLGSQDLMITCARVAGTEDTIVVAPASFAWQTIGWDVTQEVIPWSSASLNFNPKNFLVNCPGLKPLVIDQIPSGQLTVFVRKPDQIVKYAFDTYIGTSAFKKPEFVSNAHRLAASGQGFLFHATVVVVGQDASSIAILVKARSGGGKTEASIPLAVDSNGKIVLAHGIGVSDFSLTYPRQNHPDITCAGDDGIIVQHPLIAVDGQLLTSNLERGAFNRRNGIEHLGEDPVADALFKAGDPRTFLIGAYYAKPGELVLPHHIMRVQGQIGDQKLVGPDSVEAGVAFDTLRQHPNPRSLENFGQHVAAYQATGVDFRFSQQPQIAGNNFFNTVVPAECAIWGGPFHMMPRYLAYIYDLVGLTMEKSVAVVSHKRPPNAAKFLPEMIRDMHGTMLDFTITDDVTLAKMLFQICQEGYNMNHFIVPIGHIGNKFKVKYDNEQFARNLLYHILANDGLVEFEIAPAKCWLFGYRFKKLKFMGQDFPPEMLDPSLQFGENEYYRIAEAYRQELVDAMRPLIGSLPDEVRQIFNVLDSTPVRLGEDESRDLLARLNRRG
ncbi:MAG: DUF4914 family protein [Proteobacteria bacterium]|nr:DUF4914 family protein [Pseudomonadota bacterium]